MAKWYGVCQRVREISLVLCFRHGDPLAADGSEAKDDEEGVGPPEGQESFYPDDRKWEEAAVQEEKVARAPPSRTSVSEKVTGLVSCCHWPL